MNLGKKKSSNQSIFTGRNGVYATNHWMRNPWNWHNGLPTPWSIPEREMRVATFAIILPQDA